MIGRGFMVLCCIALLASAARAQGVDLELVLAVDSSGSIDGEEFELQRVGYANALTHPDVLAAIARGPYRAIAEIDRLGLKPESLRKLLRDNALRIYSLDDGPA